MTSIFQCVDDMICLCFDISVQTSDFKKRLQRKFRLIIVTDVYIMVSERKLLQKAMMFLSKPAYKKVLIQYNNCFLLFFSVSTITRDNA